MPHLYKSEEYIPELDGVIRGGTTIMIDDPSQIEGLWEICKVTQPPLEGLYHFLNAPFFSLERWFQMPLQPLQTPKERNPNWRYVITDDDAETLMRILSLAFDIWEQQGGKDAGLSLAMTIGDFASTSSPVLEYEGKSTGLLFLKGSIVTTFMQFNADLGKFFYKTIGFGAGLFRGSGITASEIATDIVEDMREKAYKRAKIGKLERLNDLTKSDLEKKRGMIVFLHGLLSTDYGTFDTLIEKWEEELQYEELIRVAPNDPEGSSKALRETLYKDFLLVGWPHDTLTGIDDNGFELCRLLEDIAIRPGEPLLIAFVCHSRGGLVARSAAAEWYHKIQSNLKVAESKSISKEEGFLPISTDEWALKPATLCGCVTFGTPHEGAALVEILSPEKFIARFVTVMMIKNTGKFAYLTDILRYQKQCKGFPGIQDLRPARTGGNFLKVLRRKERNQAPFGKQRLLDIFAIGGQAGPQDIALKAAKYMFGNSEHDLIVETSSSISRYLNQTKLVKCNHLSYFSVEQSQEPHFMEVIRYLREKLQVYEAAKKIYDAGDYTEPILPDI